MKSSEYNLGRKKHFEKKQRFYDLLKEPLIREYLELAVYLGEHNDNEFDESLLSMKAFDKLAKKTEHSSGIYMYMGKDEETNTVLLADIETLERRSISLSSYLTLSQIYNRVIYIENKNNEKDFYEKKLLEIRKEYLISLTKLDQESAKESIIKK